MSSRLRHWLIALVVIIVFVAVTITANSVAYWWEDHHRTICDGGAGITVPAGLSGAPCQDVR